MHYSIIDSIILLFYEETKPNSIKSSTYIVFIYSIKKIFVYESYPISSIYSSNFFCKSLITNSIVVDSITRNPIHVFGTRLETKYLKDKWKRKSTIKF